MLGLRFATQVYNEVGVIKGCYKTDKEGCCLYCHNSIAGVLVLAGCVSFRIYEPVPYIREQLGCLYEVSNPYA